MAADGSPRFGGTAGEFSTPGAADVGAPTATWEELNAAAIVMQRGWRDYKFMQYSWLLKGDGTGSKHNFNVRLPDSADDADLVPTSMEEGIRDLNSQFHIDVPP